MQIRPLKVEELEEYTLIFGDAFLGDPQNNEYFVENRLKPALANTRGLIGEDGRLKAVLFLNLPRLSLGASSLPMPGFDAVATPPEYRRQGYVKQLFVATLEELHKNGYSIAALYPFYFPFYKKFGFAQASTFKEITLTLEQLNKFKPQSGGAWRQTTMEEWTKYNAIYEKFIPGSFGSITRDHYNWNSLFKGSGPRPNKGYIWKNKQGEEQAYVIYQIRKDKNGERELRVFDQAWLNLEAREEIFAFLANHDSQTKKGSWLCAPDEEIFPLLEDPRQAKEEIIPGYMLRILDVKRAIEERSWPMENTSFSLKIVDDLLPWNNIAVEVETQQGKATVTPLAEGRKTGLSCDIRQLAQMYAGYLSPRKLRQIGLLAVDDPAALVVAQNLFSPANQPASYMADFF